MDTCILGQNGTKFSYTVFLVAALNVHVAFDIPGGVVVSPPDHQHIDCHIIFDDVMEDFQHRPNLYLWPGNIPWRTPATLIYANTMSQEMVCIALFVTGLNNTGIYARLPMCWMALPLVLAVKKTGSLLEKSLVGIVAGRSLWSEHCMAWSQVVPLSGHTLLGACTKWATIWPSWLWPVDQGVSIQQG